MFIFAIILLILSFLALINSVKENIVPIVPLALMIFFALYLAGV